MQLATNTGVRRPEVSGQRSYNHLLGIRQYMWTVLFMTTWLNVKEVHVATVNARPFSHVHIFCSSLVNHKHGLCTHPPRLDCSEPFSSSQPVAWSAAGLWESSLCAALLVSHVQHLSSPSLSLSPFSSQSQLPLLPLSLHCPQNCFHQNLKIVPVGLLSLLHFFLALFLVLSLSPFLSLFLLFLYSTGVSSPQQVRPHCCYYCCYCR